MELTLRYDGDEWIADRGDWRVRAPTLGELDNRLLHRLAEDGEFRQRAAIRLCLRFDMGSLPRWLHQYSGHYFNRVVTLRRPGEGKA